MSDKLDQVPGALRRDEPDGFTKRNAVEDEDVEGHSLRRDGDGAILRREAGEGLTKRNAFPDDGDDDVEGHSMLRGDDGAMRRDDEGVTRRMGPGEGHTSRT